MTREPAKGQAPRKTKSIPNMSATTAAYVMASHSRKSLDNREVCDDDGSDASGMLAFGFSQPHNREPEDDDDDGVTEDGSAYESKPSHFRSGTLANARSCRRDPFLY